MEITPDNWQRAKAVFDAALQQPPGERDSFLAAACAECGEFDDAVKWQEKAIAQATDPDREADYQSRLELYLQRKPARMEGGIER